ncbi:LysR family transcriptional regulator [Vibrio maritimus]|uniref:LysR family transcriptional regulator n=1 Tax=Vibrio maritimus TaxID=990268 RepID=UPI004067B2E2
MDIESLRSFLAFSETGSFTRAAKQINRTQSAFSAQMKKLESEVGAPLFEKEGRNVVLTEAGITLRADAKQILELHDSSLNKIKRYQNKRSLRLGCPEDYNESLLPKIISAIREYEPLCSIQVFSQPSVVLREWLDEGKLDAAIVTRSPNSEEGYWLYSDQGVWIAAENFDLSVDVLPLVLFQADCKYHAAAIDSLTKQGQAHQLLVCCNTASAQRGMVKSGLGIGVMGRVSMGSGVVELADMPPLPSVDIALLTGGKAHPMITASLIERIQSSVLIQPS